ncbi:putative T7SS-secreted protein [Kitasatospora sp. NPDC002227]|uniref:putative T7SS-secreted protein n=1 Tax=Kitasatospora sp. NPDC002227 TaxID=3154773 RepID=UPI00332957CB
MGLWGEAKAFAGEFVDMHAHMAGGLLDAVGLDDWAHKVDKWGDGIADDLGAAVGELNLGETDDPKELVHGDAKALGDTAKHLQNFASAFEDAYNGLSRMDADHWQGKAAEAFRKRFGEHPVAWRITAEACTDAAKALDALSQAVDSAQKQAQQAIDAYNHAQEQTKDARDQYKHQVDSYNHAVDDYNNAVKSGQSPTQPTRPGDFADPGTEGRRHAAELLLNARKAKHGAAQTAESAIKAATGKAPKKAGFWAEVGMDLQDAPQLALTSYEHVQVGIVKGAAEMLKFGRGLNPMDPYNLTHPAQYFDHVNQTAAGLVEARDHPMQLLSSVVGSGWGSDPSEALGKTIFNLGSGLVTGGGSEAAAVGARIGIDAVESAAKNEAVHLGEDAAANTAKNVGEQAVGDLAKPPVEPVKPVSTNPAGLPDDWLKPPSQGGTNPFAAEYGGHPDFYNPHPEPTDLHAGEQPHTDLDSHSPGGDAPGNDGAAPDHGSAEPAGHDGGSSHDGTGHEPGADHVGGPDHATDDSAAHQTSDDLSFDHADSGDPASGHSSDTGGQHGHLPAEDFKNLPLDQQRQIAEAEVSGGAKTFGSNEEAEAYGGKHWNDKVLELPQEEKNAVFDYTCEGKTDSIGGLTYKDINGELRAQGPLSPGVARHVEELDRAMKANPIPEDVMVTRGTDLGHIDMDPRDMVGETFDEHSYTSVSLGGPAPGFEQRDAILHLRAPEGTPGVWVEKVGKYGMGERELILGRGMKWRATRVIEREDGKWDIYGEILP